MKRILLTGGGGFVGRNVTASFLAKKYDIVAPTHAELNLADTDAVDAFFSHRSFDAVWHFATKPGHRDAADTSALFYTNVRMFENLARHADKFGVFINAGSGAVYDNARNVSGVSENEVFQRVPADEHGFCKYVVAKRIASLNGFVDLNIFGIFGKHENYAIRFISNAICKTLCGLPVTLRQNRRFSYLYVDDLMPVLDFFTQNKASFFTYNVTPDTVTTLVDAARLVQKISGKDTGLHIAADGFGCDYYGNNARLKAEMPQITFTPLEKAVEKLYAWYKTHRADVDKTRLLTDK